MAILEVHRAMLRDPSLVDESRRLVREERVNVEWAVKRTIRKIKGAFSEDDEFFRERRSDVDYVGERIVKNLLGQGVDVVETPPPGSIVVARDLSPADTAILFHDRKVAGLVTDAGGITSHTAIVARALEIPAVVGAGEASHDRRARRLDRRGRRPRPGGGQPQRRGAGRLRGGPHPRTWSARPSWPA